MFLSRCQSPDPQANQSWKYLAFDEYKGHKYWVTVEPAIHDETKETGFIAYVSDQKLK
jgi:hypothetical protein